MEEVNIISTGSQEFINQDYSPKDENLFNTFSLNRDFGAPQDVIELHVFDGGGELLTSSYDYKDYSTNLTNPSSSLFNNIELDPEQDVKNLGLEAGTFNTTYYPYRNLFLSNEGRRYFIKEISDDRTELRVTTNELSYDALSTSYFNYINSKTNKSFYSDFLLNFGDNITLLGVNTLLDTSLTTEPSIFIKLYEPLPDNLQIKDTLWFSEQVSDPFTFKVDISIIPDEEEDDVIVLRGPNTNVDLNDKANISTKYLNVSEILDSPLTSSLQQIKSILEEKSANININFEEYENFVHFSSAYNRLENFREKLILIERFQADINTLKGVGALTDKSFISSSEATLQNNIDKVIEQFDGYEYFLYFTSGSKAWPKSGSNIAPYSNWGTNTPTASIWYGSKEEDSDFFGGQILSASLYDDLNRNYIWNTLPAYIKEDTQNANLELLSSMLGQHFDTLWTYTRAIGDIKDNDNRIDKGISKDLVADTLRSLGIKLYTSNRTNENLFSDLLGLSPSGSATPDTGSQRVETYVSVSNEANTTDTLNKEVYKRIYNNLPYLLKTRGTRQGLRALINCFGIPETILKVNEYGGDQKNVPTVNQIVDKFAYSLHTNPLNLTSSISSSVINIPWLPFVTNFSDEWQSVNVNWNVIEGVWNGPKAASATPDTVEFRFKTNGIPSSSYYSQSLFQIRQDSDTKFGVQLLYPSASNASYGSPVLNDRYSVYGELRFFLSGSQGYAKTQPIYAPFFSGSWWSLKLNRETGSRFIFDSGSNQDYTLTVKSTDYNGKDGTFIKYQASQSLHINGTTSASYNGSWHDFRYSSGNLVLDGHLGGTGSNNVLSPNGVVFDGSFQEARMWSTVLSESVFNQHVLDPRSIRSNEVTSSMFDLIFRLPLGNDLQISGSFGDNKVTSVHPSITGSFVPTASFFLGTGSSTVSYGIITNFTGSSYQPTEYFALIESPNLGAYNPVDDKIINKNQNEVSGSTLSPYVSIQDYSFPPNQYTLDVNDVEVAISPQDSINRDITEQLGYFNVDEFIGDPKLALSSSYDGLDHVKKFYFDKYFRKQNITDIVQLLSYFDSSLFKMIRDFVPAKAELTTGFLIKSHLLERNKTKRFDPTFTFIDFSGSLTVPSITGSNPMNENLDTSYTGEILIPSSSANTITASGVTFNFTDNREPITGEFSGSEFIAYTQPTSSMVTEKSLFRVGPDTSTAASFSLIPFNPELNNVSEARKSNQFIDVDYSTNVVTPVNIGFITSRSFGDITEADSPFLDAPIQDSNYTLQRYLRPRYLGSKTISQEYNVYNEGDESYGSSPSIDLNSLKFAYFSEIVETGSAFPERANVYLKYLIDGRSNIVELTRENEFIFDVQNIFNQKKQLDIALDNNIEFSDQKYLDGVKPIYAGGFSYLPMLQNPTGSSTLVYKFTTGSIENEDQGDILPLPDSLEGNYVQIGNYELGNIQVVSGSNFVSIAGTPSINLTRNTPVNRDSIWWDNDLLINVEGGLEFKLTIPKNPSASFDDLRWNPFNGTSPLQSSSIDLGESAIIKAVYYVSNSAVVPKNTDSTNALLEYSDSALGGVFQTSDSNPLIGSASLEIGLQFAQYSVPKQTYYYPSDPIVSITGSITDGGDADNGGAFFLRNNTGSFNILTASVSMSYYFGNFQQTSSIYVSQSDSFGVVDEEFFIEEGDIFRFVDKKAGSAGTGSGIFPREFERQVKRVNNVFRDEVTNTRRITIEFDKDIPARACEDFTTAANGNNARQIKRFVILKKVEDETNIVLDFPKQQGKTSSGIILSTDVPKVLKDQAGNIVKELKSQNLIS